MNTKLFVAWAQDIPRSWIRNAIIIFVVLSGLFAAAQFGAVSHLRRWAPQVSEYLFGPSPTYQTPTEPSALAMLEATKQANPDIYGELDEVLAVHPVKMREHLLATVQDPHAMLLMARSWGLTVSDFTGDGDEIIIFIDYLNQPIDTTHNDDDLRGLTDRGGARSASLWAIAKAVTSRAGYDEMFPSVRDVAIKHIGYSPYREYSLVILLMLREQGYMDDESDAAIDKALEHPLWRRRFESRYDDIKAFLVSGKMG